MSELEPLSLNRQQVVRLLAIQGLVLLAISCGWWYLNPELPVQSHLTLNWAQLMIGIMAGSVLLLSSTFILWCYEDLRQSLRFVDHLLLRHLSPSQVFYVTVVSSIPEELFFRGILQNQFGIVAASLLFGLVHVPGRHFFAYGLWATCAGFYLGYLYDYTHSLPVVIIAHGVHNLLGLWVWLKYRQRFLGESAGLTPPGANGD